MKSLPQVRRRLSKEVSIITIDVLDVIPESIGMDTVGDSIDRYLLMLAMLAHSHNKYL